MTDGVIVTHSGTTRAEMTFDLDHFFLESLISPDAAIHFGRTPHRRGPTAA